MSWSEAWHQGMRRRVRWHMAGIASMAAVTVLTAVVAGAGLMSVLGRSEASWFRGATTGLVTVMVAPTVVMLVMLLYLVRRLRREQATLRLVPAHDGMVCPRCRRTLTVRGERARCAACKRDYLASQVRDDWAQYPHVNSTFWQPGSLRSDRLRTLAWSIRNRPWCGAALSLVVWIAGVAWYAWITNHVLIFAMIKMSYILLFFVAIQLTAMGAKRRVGDSLHCTKCDYERAPTGSGESCPECGLGWREPGALVRGRVTRSPALIWAGAAIFLVYAALLLSGQRLRTATPTWLLFTEVSSEQAAGGSSVDIWPVLTARSLSPEDQERLTDLLIQEIIVAPRGFVNREWAVLLPRSLTEAQVRRLFEGLLAKHDRKSYLSADDHRWMESMIQTGAIPAELAERYPRD